MQCGQGINKSSKIAFIFDFDDTLTADSTTELLKEKGIDVDDFWKGRFKARVEEGWEPTLAYLNLLIDYTQPGEKLHRLTNAELKKFGGTLDLYPGLPDFFGWIRKKLTSYLPYAEVSFWVISGGLEPIIKGCTRISRELSGIWACRLAGEKENESNPIKYIKRAISFTEKTRYLFHINKGHSPAVVDQNPAIVNQGMAFVERPVPVHNMLYIGDGLTDIPCFSVILSGRGVPLGIDDKQRSPSAKQEIIRDILFARRTFGLYSPDYRRSSDLCSQIQNGVAGICNAIVTRRSLP